jgi:D-alanyl-D-alanine carboxypeptidase
MRTRIFLLVLALVTSVSAPPATAALSPSSIPEVFNELLDQPVLANPAMILIDVTTGEVIYGKNALSARKPASIMKIFAGAATIKYLDMQSRFVTKVSLGVKKKTLVVQGSYDPWIGTTESTAKKMDRTSLPYLALKSLSAAKESNNGSTKGFTVLYSRLFPQDVANLKSFWAKRGFYPLLKSVTNDESSLSASELIVSGDSPPISEILRFTLQWSVNSLAERLGRLSARAAGYSFNNNGTAQVFQELLTEYAIDSSELVVKDASGLSRSNRITATMMGELLYKLRKDPKYELIYESLPISGVSGTLQTRFLKTAPNAVGLVRGKTGLLNGTVNLAGYIQSSEREYVFVTLADQIPRGNAAKIKAQAAIDRLLGRIAAPYESTEISAVPVTP